MVCLRLAVATSLFLSAKASYANIKGICNYYGSTVHFTNTEHSGNNCDAPSMDKCDAKRAFIPKCESVTDFDKHHMQVRSDDEQVNLKLWKDDGAGKIYGGSDYGTADEMADEVKKGEWNIVINPDASVYLYLTSDPQNCPPPPPPACTATDVKGQWLYQYTIAGTTGETWMHGTTKSHSESETTTWSNSVTTTVSEGFLVEGVQVATTISKAVAQAYTDEWSESEQQTWQVTFGDNDVGKAAWQFQFEETDSCSHVEHTLVREYALTPNAATPPCCVPGYAHDAPAYRICVSEDALVPGVCGCSVASVVEV